MSLEEEDRITSSASVEECVRHGAAVKRYTSYSRGCAKQARHKHGDESVNQLKTR